MFHKNLHSKLKYCKMGSKNKITTRVYLSKAWTHVKFVWVYFWKPERFMYLNWCQAAMVCDTDNTEQKTVLINLFYSLELPTYSYCVKYWLLWFCFAFHKTFLWEVVFLNLVHQRCVLYSFCATYFRNMWDMWFLKAIIF